MGHLLTDPAHSEHMAVCPQGWKEISHGPSQRKQLGPVAESTSSLSSLLLESPPDTDTSGGVASGLVGVVSVLVGVASVLVGLVSVLVGVALVLEGVALSGEPVLVPKLEICSYFQRQIQTIANST